MRNKRAPQKLISSNMKKKGVSEVIGYILLITFAIIMSVIIYQGLKTYVPAKALECPDGTSIFIKSALCTLNAGGTYDLELTIKNNGRHNLGGYFIHASLDNTQTVATYQLVNYTNDVSTNVYQFGNAVIFEIAGTGNFVNVSESKFAEYNDIPGRMYSLDIIPVRFQKEANRFRLVSCGKAITREK